MRKALASPNREAHFRFLIGLCQDDLAVLFRIGADFLRLRPPQLDIVGLLLPLRLHALENRLLVFLRQIGPLIRTS